MLEPTSDKHYEDKFEFPLWTMIKQRAEEKDISYVEAIREVVPEYQKTIRYKDIGTDLADLREPESKKKSEGG